MSFLRHRSKIDDRDNLRELGQVSNVSVAGDTSESRPQTDFLLNKRKKPSTINTIDLENKITELQTELEKEQNRCNELRIAMHARQERYVKREQEYRTTVSDYEKKLNGGTSPQMPRIHDTTAKNIKKVTQYHSQIIDKISSVQQRTMSLLKDQELDIVKEFNNRLGEKFQELESEKKNESGTGEMTGIELKIYQELEQLKGKVDSVDAKNKHLTQKNSELKMQTRSHDQDKKILDTQLALLRGANEKLKRTLQEVKTSSPKIPLVRNKSARIHSSVSSSSKKEPTGQYESVINKLKRMVELEQKNIRAARTAHARELEAKKELESVLRLCVDDVKSHITRKRNEQRMHNSEKSIDDIEKMIEILLSQERVLTLLYDKTFPPRSVMKEPFFNGIESRGEFNADDNYVESEAYEDMLEIYDSNN
jgi:myosin heavy subunit